MWHILISLEKKLPTLIKGSDHQYPIFIRQGYEVKFSGMRHVCEKRMKEIMQELCTGLLGSDSDSVASHSCTAVKK